jgi:hypothetical protein
LQQDGATEARATVPIVPPVKVIVGADVYPLPAEFITIDVTTLLLSLGPPDKVAVPVAAEPPFPGRENTTVGALVYAAPWLSIVAAVTM